MECFSCATKSNSTVWMNGFGLTPLVVFSVILWRIVTGKAISVPDESVGGVTTRQRILEPTRRWITRWADWLELPKIA